jgi:hypothetical protein
LFLIGYIEKNSGLNFSKTNPDFLNIRIFEVLKGCTELEVGIYIRTCICLLNMYVYVYDIYAYVYTWMYYVCVSYIYIYIYI